MIKPEATREAPKLRASSYLPSANYHIEQPALVIVFKILYQIIINVAL